MAGLCEARDSDLSEELDDNFQCLMNGRKKRALCGKDKDDADNAA